MKIEYNGIALDLLELHAYERQNVYTPDGCDLLFVRHRLNMTCTLASGGSPNGLSAAQVGPYHPLLKSPPRLSGFVGAQPGVYPPARLYRGPDPFGGEQAAMTDKLLSPLLLTPRKKLKITAYRPVSGDSNQAQAVTWLESPLPGMECDSMSGPHPLGCTVTEPVGDAPASAVLNYQIETHLPLLETDAARCIVSHRWTSSISHDDDYYVTRTVSGEAVFDQALLKRFGENPGEFLNQLYHPIPLGFRRSLPDVTLSSDGCKLTYAFADTAVPCVFSPGETGATQCWIEEEWKYVSPMGMGFDVIGKAGNKQDGGPNRIMGAGAALDKWKEGVHGK